MTQLSALIRNTGYLMFGEIAKPALSFVLILVIARLLGTEGIGTYTIILTVTGLIEIVVTAGISPLVVRGIAANRSQVSTWVSRGIGSALLVSVIFVPLALLALSAVDYPPEVERGIAILMLTLVVVIVQSQVLALCEGLQMMRFRSLLTISDGAARLTIGVLMIAGGYGVLGVIGGIVIARTATTAGALLLLKRRLGLVADTHAAFVHSLALVRSAVPFLTIALVSTGFWAVNTLLLSALRPISEVGVYTAALRLPDMLRTMFFSYMIALLPMMSQSFVTSMAALKHQCDASIKYMALITIPISTGLALLAPRLVTLIYGREFDAAIPVLQVLAWMVCTFSVALVFGRVLVASHNEVLDMYCNVAALSVNVVLGWPLILWYGPLGAAVAAVASLAVFGVLEGVFVSRRLFRVDIVAPLARAACASIIMALALRSVADQPLVVIALLGGAVYVGVLLCLGTFSRSELATARRLLTARLNSVGVQPLPTFDSRGNSQ